MKKADYVLVMTTKTGNTRYFKNPGRWRRETTANIKEAMAFTTKKAAYDELAKLPKDELQDWEVVVA